MDEFRTSGGCPREPRPAADGGSADDSQVAFARQFEALVRHGNIVFEPLPSGMVYFRLLRFDWPQPERGEGTEGTL